MDYSKPHQRFNPLIGEWVLVSPQRCSRPWQGQIEKVTPVNLPQYDPNCYLCPGNKRAGGKHNPDYSSTFVFDNDFPALVSDEDNSDQMVGQQSGLSITTAEPVNGICRVVCFSPRHDLTLPELSLAEIESVIKTWTKQTTELGALDNIAYVQIFENKGAAMGCSNPHPHSQIWSTSIIPNEPLQELKALTEYRKTHKSCLLCDYLVEEIEADQRIVASNEHFVALVPFWAVWPFEIMIISRRHVGSLSDLEPEEVKGLAEVMKKVTIKYDNLFEVSFPYSMGFHQAAMDGSDNSIYHLHAHYYPPLLRSATVRKFLVGFEMLAMPQRDLTAETAASRLRDLADIHYKS